MTTIRLMAFLLSVAVFICGAGCKPKPPPDPLAGWSKYIITDSGQPSPDPSHLPDKAITDDYQAYIGTLPSDQAYIARSLSLQCFCEDGTGQHAIQITIQAYGEVWTHVLIYDKSDKRVKTIKYLSGRYQS
jgi:hypothetical protein